MAFFKENYLIILFILLVIAAFFVHPKSPKSTHTKLSANVIQQVNAELQRIPGAIGITVLKVDLKTNTRYVVYRNETDIILRDMFNTYFAHRMVTEEEPFFVRDNNAINERLVKLVNHQFDCSPYKATIASRLIPESATRVSTVCSIAVPPQYGSFTGFVTIYFSKEPSDQDIELIRIQLNYLSQLVSHELSKD